mmetsp:Transcript_25152/g.100084  ORF Transcript_25152/g.100084 Transcript_25152/m.100084 type:complete len:212 (+) Transcript_25152:165-800(+)
MPSAPTCTTHLAMTTTTTTPTTPPRRALQFRRPWTMPSATSPTNRLVVPQSTRRSAASASGPRLRRRPLPRPLTTPSRASSNDLRLSSTTRRVGCLNVSSTTRCVGCVSVPPSPIGRRRAESEVRPHMATTTRARSRCFVVVIVTRLFRSSRPACPLIARGACTKTYISGSRNVCVFPRRPRLSATTRPQRRSTTTTTTTTSERTSEFASS